jgi:predicted DNA-binding protein
VVFVEVARIFNGTLYQREVILLPQLHIRVSDELNRRINALAAAEGTSKAEIIRRILYQHTAENAAEESLDVVAETIRQVIRAELKRVEDRLAKIGVKNTLAAATSMFLNLAALDTTGKNSAEWYQAARKKAVSYLRFSEDLDQE